MGHRKKGDLAGLAAGVWGAEERGGALIDGGVADGESFDGAGLIWSQQRTGKRVGGGEAGHRP
jgi:hypothetical protein